MKILESSNIFFENLMNILWKYAQKNLLDKIDFLQQQSHSGNEPNKKYLINLLNKMQYNENSNEFINFVNKIVNNYSLPNMDNYLKFSLSDLEKNSTPIQTVALLYMFWNLHKGGKQDDLANTYVSKYLFHGATTILTMDCFKKALDKEPCYNNSYELPKYLQTPQQDKKIYQFELSPTTGFRNLLETRFSATVRQYTPEGGEQGLRFYKIKETVFDNLTSLLNTMILLSLISSSKFLLTATVAPFTASSTQQKKISQTSLMLKVFYISLIAVSLGLYKLKQCFKTKPYLTLKFDARDACKGDVLHYCAVVSRKIPLSSPLAKKKTNHKKTSGFTIRSFHLSNE